MIRGRVSPERAAVVRVSVRGPNGDSVEVDATIDTGFTDFLALPSDVISALGLPYDATFPATLGDGSTAQMDFYRAAVTWLGREQVVQALGTDADALVGMSLLNGNRLTIDVTPGGTITIDPLP